MSRQVKAPRWRRLLTKERKVKVVGVEAAKKPLTEREEKGDSFIYRQRGCIE
jgi:hypothetical protein